MKCFIGLEGCAGCHCRTFKSLCLHFMQHGNIKSTFAFSVSHHRPRGGDKVNLLAGLIQISDIQALMNCDLPFSFRHEFQTFIKASPRFLLHPFSLTKDQSNKDDFHL